MPSPTTIHAMLTINYDAAKDLIFISADKGASPELAAGGLYITLKKHTPSEAALRKYLMDRDVIRKPEAAGLDFENLIASRKLGERNAKLLQLLARDGRGAVVLGAEREGTLWATVAYVNAGRHPKVIALEADAQPEGGSLTDYFSEAISLSPKEAAPGSDGNVTVDWLLTQAYRMRADFIVVNAHDGQVALSEITPRAERGMLYRMDYRRGVGEALTSLRKRGANVDAAIFVEADPEAEGFRIVNVELLA